MLDLTKENFEEEVLKAEGYVFVDFYGDGCVPCQALMPKVHEFADTYGDKMKFTSLNTTKARVKDDATPENIEAMIKKYI